MLLFSSSIARSKESKISKTFHAFADLPYELRMQIWEHTLQPRIIPLQCQIQCAESSPETFLYHSFFTTSAANTPSDEEPSSSPSSSVDIRIHFSAARYIAFASSLLVCNESRKCAISAGYRVWRLRDEFGHRRDVMWNPALDTVSIASPHRGSMPRLYGELFRRQFPVEVALVQRIGIPGSCWREDPREKLEVAECWGEYAQLKTLVVVLGPLIQSYNGGGLSAMIEAEQLEAEMLEIVRGGNESLHKIADQDSCVGWNVPSLLLVKDERRILRAA